MENAPIIMLANPTILNLRLTVFYAMLLLFVDIGILVLSGYMYVYGDRVDFLLSLLAAFCCILLTSALFAEVAAMIVRLSNPNAQER